MLDHRVMLSDIVRFAGVDLDEFFALDLFSRFGIDVVGVAGEFGQREVGFVLDLELAQDVIRAELVGVVDRVDDDGLEGMPSPTDLRASVEQILPSLDRRLVDIERIEARLGGKEQCVVGIRAQRRFTDLRLPIDQHGQIREVGLRLGLGSWQ